MFVLRIAVCLIAGWAAVASAAERLTVTFEQAGLARSVEGTAVLEDQEGGLLLLDRGGRYWSIPAPQIKDRATHAEAFQPLSAEDLGAELRREFGPAFEIVRTEHYVLCTDAGKRFGEWTGKLFERLRKGFEDEWQDSGIELSPPVFPLPVIIFAKEADYREYARRDVGSLPVDMGYYSSLTNRVALRDLTPASSKSNTSDLSRIVNAANVTTLVHEATHQLAFNTGFHVRLADNPMWLTEGLAIYFESPDLKNASGWKTTGQINRTRLQRYRDYARQRRKPGSLERLVANNDRLSRPESAADAYAEAWLLTHFLKKKHPAGYARYVQSLQKKVPLDFGTDADRLEAFRAVFGEDPMLLEKEFEAYVSRLSR